MARKAQSFSRLHRVNELLQQTLAPIVQREIATQEMGLITILEVDVSPDLSTAKVFFTVMQEAHHAACLQRLQAAAPALRHLLSQQITLRRVPKLQFVYDATVVNAHRIGHLIDTAIEEDKKDKQ